MRITSIRPRVDARSEPDGCTSGQIADCGKVPRAEKRPKNQPHPIQYPGPMHPLIKKVRKMKAGSANLHILAGK